jgi:hypothetical protein
VRLSVEIPDDIHRQLKSKAASEGTNISEIVRIAVERYLHGNFTVGLPAVANPPNPPNPVGMVRPISKADQAKGRTRR